MRTLMSGSGNSNNATHIIEHVETSTEYKETDKRQVIIQAGANSNQNIFLNYRNINTHILGIDDVKIDTLTQAQNAISRLQDSINTISKERSVFGAYQNSMEHTLSYSNNSSENLQASESGIRDSDMAKEISELSKHNILEEAGQTLLAQANHSKDGILNLLQ